MDEVVRATLAVDRVVAALNAGGATPESNSAFSDDVELVRYGWGQSSDQIAEQRHGRAELQAWMARTPATARFTRVGDAIPQSEGVAIARYALEMDGFKNGGRWRFRLSDDGRVQWWEHRPGDLDPDIQDAEWRTKVEIALATDPSLRPTAPGAATNDPRESP